MRAGLLLTTVLLLILFGGHTARACDCVTLPERESLDADLVFEGKLIGIQRMETNGLGTFTYVFQVDKTLKGPYLTTVALTSDNTDCDAKFQPKFGYRVYAKNFDGRFVSGACSGNKILSTVGGYSSYSTYTVKNTPVLWYRRFITLSAICVLGALLGSGVFFWRKYVSRIL